MASVQPNSTDSPVTLFSPAVSPVTARSLSVAGIDLATGEHKVVVIDMNGNLLVLTGQTGKPSFHAGVYTNGTAAPVFGDAAEQEGLRDPAGYRSTIKPDRGTGVKIGGHHSTEELDTTLLKTVIMPASQEQARENMGPVVLTAPNGAGDPYCAAITTAAQNAGLIVVAVIREASAAAKWALHSGAMKPSAGEVVAVVDMGAGTTDIAIGKMGANQSFEIQASDSLMDHAGHKLLRLCAAAVLESAGKQHGTKAELDKLDPLARYSLMNGVETAVRQFGQRDSVRVPVPIGGKTQLIEFKGAEFKRVLESFTKPVAGKLDQMLASAKIPWSKVTQVLVSGGPSQNKALRDELAGQWKAPVIGVRDAQTAVARGAALHALDLLAASGKVNGVLPPDTGRVVDCTSNDISIAVVDRSGGSAPALRCACVGPSGSPIGFVSETTFALARADQTTVIIRILQGKEGQPAETATVLGEVTFHNLPVEAVRTGRIKVRVEITALSMAKVDITDTVGGQTKSVSLKA